MKKLLKKFDKVLNDELVLTERQIYNLIKKLRNLVLNEKEEVIVEDKISKYFNRYNLE